jgi:hypothetical protein
MQGALIANSMEKSLDWKADMEVNNEQFYGTRSLCVIKNVSSYFFHVALQSNFGPWPPPWNFQFHFGYQI